LLRLQDSQNSILNLDLKSTYEVKMSVIEKGLEANKNEEFFLLYKTLLKIQNTNTEEFISIKSFFEQLIE